MGDPAILSVSSGTLRGTVLDGVRRFLGIPYAAPPFGPRRFADPAAPDAWSGERDATAFGATSPQRPYTGTLGELLHPYSVPGDDILTANIWAPVGAEAAPVVVWIHGGALERGAAGLPAYDGTAFARDGVVFVSFNYRLGTEGFVVLDGAPLNLGLRDCAAAIKWVAREIGAAGGDPRRITVMGESAGGAIAAALLSRADTRPLIAGAIIQSAPLEIKPRDNAAKVTNALCKRLGVPATVAAWRELSPDVLLDARAELARGSTPLSGAPMFALCLDDDMPDSPDKLLPTIKDIPILIGTNTDEYRLWFTAADIANIGWFKLLATRLWLRVPSAAMTALWDAFPSASYGEIFGQLVTDMFLRLPAVRLAAAREQTWVYEFAWASPVRDLRAAHAIEIGFAMDTLRVGDARRLAGEDAPQALADEMHGAWVRFIKTGTPGWDGYAPDRTVRVFDVESRTQGLPRADIMDALM